MATNFRVAVLDDISGSPPMRGPWHLLADGVEVEYFHDHLSDERDVAARLAPFEAVVAMRERTPFRLRS